MPLTLSHCLPADAPELGRVLLAIWSSSPRGQVAWGNVPDSERIKRYEKNIYEGMTVQKQCKLPQEKHYLKVTDDATGEIAAYAVWIYLPEGYCAEDEYAGLSKLTSPHVRTRAWLGFSSTWAMLTAGL